MMRFRLTLAGHAPQIHASIVHDCRYKYEPSAPRVDIAPARAHPRPSRRTPAPAPRRRRDAWSFEAVCMSRCAWSSKLSCFVAHGLLTMRVLPRMVPHMDFHNYGSFCTSSSKRCVSRCARPLNVRAVLRMVVLQAVLLTQRDFPKTGTRPRMTHIGPRSTLPATSMPPNV